MFSRKLRYLDHRAKYWRLTPRDYANFGSARSRNKESRSSEFGRDNIGKKKAANKTISGPLISRTPSNFNFKTAAEQESDRETEFRTTLYRDLTVRRCNSDGAFKSSFAGHNSRGERGRNFFPIKQITDTLIDFLCTARSNFYSERLSQKEMTNRANIIESGRTDSFNLQDIFGFLEFFRLSYRNHFPGDAFRRDTRRRV